MPKWTFITNQGIVFLIISRQNRITAREIAKEIGVKISMTRRSDGPATIVRVAPHDMGGFTVDAPTPPFTRWHGT